jgi:drug/metabolite transporter (DMT)-like permease
MLFPQGERLTVRGWLGLLVGLAGVIILVAPRPFRVDIFLQNTSPLLVLGSAAFWALGALFLRRQKSHAPHLTLAGYQMAIGGLSLCALGLLCGEAARLPETISARAATVFIYLLLVGSLVGFVAFNWLLRHVSATKVGTYAYVNPVVAVIIAWTVGEEITWEIQAGICTILAGVFLVRGGERAPPPPPGPASTGLAEPASTAEFDVEGAPSAADSI